jgi:mannose-6-phosphate isomerase-like protein (cupin superfamily)
MEVVAADGNGEGAYVRRIDFPASTTVAKRGELAMHTLLGYGSGARHCLINALALPPQTSSPLGRHTHKSEQVSDILSGTPTFEIDGRRLQVPAGSIQITTLGAPHRNWNERPEDLHLISFHAPLPDPAQPIAHPVDAPADT